MSASGISARRRGLTLSQLTARSVPRSSSRGPLVVGIVILSIVALLSIIVPALSRSPDALIGQPLQPPTGHHFFGLDAYGRDVWVRTWAAGRVDLLVAAIGSGVSLVVGTVIGMLIGATRVHWVASIATRIIDAVIAFPFIILALTLTLVIGHDRSFGPLPAGVPAVIVAVGVVNWTIFARLARAEALSLRSRDFVVAARLLGYSKWRIQLRHLLPAVIRTTAAYAVNNAVMLIIVTASLAFLGAGAQPPAAEWGALMYAGRTVLENAWWITILPGLVLALTALGVSLIGDWLLATRSGRSNP
jgi:peptide/nickel transport system permease protein